MHQADREARMWHDATDWLVLRFDGPAFGISWARPGATRRT
jgi:hypothetical protein